MDNSRFNSKVMYYTFIKSYKAGNFNECLSNAKIILNNDSVQSNILNMLIELTKNLDDLHKVMVLFNINLEYTNILLKESTISVLIKKYCYFNLQKQTFDKELNHLLHILECNYIPLKNRIFSPILDMYYQLSDDRNIIKYYNYCFHNNVKLLDIDYCKIIATLLKKKSNISQTLSVIKDFVDKIICINKDSIQIIEEYITKTEINIDGICNKTLNKLNKLEMDNNIKNDILKYISQSSDANEFKKFEDYIKSREFDIVIDGANVGFYNQRPEFGDKLHYQQINKIVKYFENINRNILIILHERHLKCSGKNKKIIQTWINKKIIYFTPKFVNDDIYWIYSSLFKDCLLVTNDKIKDHKFIINNICLDNNKLSQFELWFNDCNIKFDLKKEMKVEFPKKYSERIQKIDNYLYLPVINDITEWYYLNI